ncbi:MAG: DUF1501 domain-containing protein [Planctomycetaceae bacterium]|nr:DUF1501 domain-containing protein [Planctomycetaceae bacterium]
MSKRPRSRSISAAQSLALEQVRRLTRRHFLGEGVSLGAAALALLSHRGALADDAAASPLAGLPHHAPRVKRVIYLQMLGGPSQLDLFDYKPKLNDVHGQDVPTSLFAGQRLAFVRGTKKFLGTPFEFQQYGASGAWVSNLLPHLSGLVDELTFIKSMETDQFNHGPAWNVLTTGYPQAGKPSLGAWINYGLGNAQQNLPDFAVLVPGMRNSGGKGMWGAGFLPARHQGVELRTQGETVPFLSNPQGIDAEARRDTIEAVAALDRIRLSTMPDDEIGASIASYELAYQMQTSVPELMDFQSETQATLDLYGIDKLTTAYARSCLVARRLVERGVRFVQICYEGEPLKAIWDCHGDTRRASLEVGLPHLCQQIDQPTAGLIRDLRQRGLLDDTLVIWGGEFGRTPMNEDRPGAEKGYTGRDHWPRAGTMFLAGGGIKPGFTLGATDELGFGAVEDPVPIHDLNATLLHLLGIDHKRLTYRFQGRDFRLTDVYGNVIHKLLA